MLRLDSKRRHAQPCAMSPVRLPVPNLFRARPASARRASARLAAPLPFPALRLPSLFVAALCITALLAAGPVALAQETDDGGAEKDPAASTVRDEIVVSASHLPVDGSTVGSSVTVIGRDEIEASHATTVQELLRTVPGVAVAQLGGPGKASSVFLRGGNSSHTLVLIDGARVNTNTGGLFDFADLTTDHIERIEILRGPQSTLYGSEAVAGVISIVSRRGEGEPTLRGGAELGSEEHRRFHLGFDGVTGPVDFSLSAGTVRLDGVSAASESAGNSEVDPWENTTVSGTFGTEFLGDGRAELALRYTEGDTEIDGFSFGIGPTDDLNTRQLREQLSGALTLTKPLGHIWTQTLTVSLADESLEGEDPDPEDVFSNFRTEDTTTAVTLRSDLQLGEQNTLTFGYRDEEREGVSVGAFEQTVDIRSFFAENRWSSADGRVHLSVGVRNDDHSTFGDETTFRLTVSARLAPSSRLHGSYGTGFKAPTFFDLFFPGFGNPDLRPETSEGFDLGYEGSWADGRWEMGFTVFGNDFEDLIQFTFPAGLINVAEARSEGFELEGRFTASERFRLRASHTYTDTEDRATGLQLARRPEHRTALQVDVRPADRWRVGLSAFAVRDRIDSDGADMDDYERVDLAAEYELTQRLSPYLRVENLFDQDYEEVPGYTARGLTAIVGLDFSFH